MLGTNLPKPFIGNYDSQPNLWVIKRIKSKLIGIRLFSIHDLHMSRPLNLLTLLNGLPKISLRVIRILAANLYGVTASELLLIVF